MPLPLLQKLLGHSSIRTTALYWHDTDEDGSHDAPDTSQVKNWLERHETSQNKEPTEPLTTENVYTFPKQPLANSETVIIPQKSAITSQKNSPALISIEPKPIIEIKAERKISTISEQSPLITDKKEKPIAQEQILLAKIKQLEEQLKQTQELAQQEKNRADKAEQLLKQIKLEQAQENQAQIVQPLPWKFK